MQTVRGTDGSAVQLNDDMAPRVRFVVKYLADRGHALTLTEGYRPVGVPADQYVTNESRTSTGGSNQWYQWGRYQRGLTPSAAWPGTSRHGTGSAIDWSSPTSAGMRARAEAMHMVGLVANVASESWHAEPLGAVLVDLSPFKTGSGQTPAAAPVTPALPKENPMWLIRTKDTGRIYVVTANGVHWLNAELVGFYRRMIEHHGGDGKEMIFYQHEVNKIDASLKAARGSTEKVSAADLAKLLAAQIKGEIGAAIEKLDVQAGASASEIADELAKRLTS